MKTILLIILLCTLGTVGIQAQTILDEYIAMGLASNQEVQQKTLALEKSMLALKEAKTLFYPRVNFEADYFLADGGRTVDFPAGDLLNPVYRTLNELTQSGTFPMLENERILLNPNNFYDARIRTTLPIINAEIVYNRRIKSNLVGIENLELLIFQRELVKNIKIAYFNYLKALEAVRIFEAALELTKESSRINEALFRNDKVNRTILIRSENEVIKFQNQLEASKQDAKNAQGYFNFLLNRDLVTEILVSSNQTVLPQQESHEVDDFQGREEINQLSTLAQLDQERIGLARSYLIPKINTFLDLGSQGFDWEYTNQTRYYFFGLSTRWNIFSAGQNKLLVKQATVDKKITLANLDQVSEQLKLALMVSHNNYNATYFKYQSSIRQYESAKRAYGDAMKLYSAGQILFIELLDAQNQLITAQLQQNINLFDCHIGLAEIERANASFNLNNN